MKIHIRSKVVLWWSGLLITSVVLALVLTAFVRIVSEEQEEPIIESSAYIYSDISAQTGFLNSEDIMARFECVGRHVSEEELHTVYLIDMYSYPELDNPVSYRVEILREIK